MPRKRLRVKRHTVTQPSDQSYRLIPLTQGKNAIVDAADFEWLSQWNWFADRSRVTEPFIAKRNIKAGGPSISMHRQIMGCGDGEQVDHRNYDTLDNRRANLRNCTSTQNSQHRRPRSDSTSGLKGVWFNPKEGKWRAHIKGPTKRYIIGRYRTAEEAARAYDAEAKKLHGDFAVLNFPSH